MEFLSEDWPGASIDSVKFSNIAEASGPARVSFELKSYPYAEIVGDRMIFLANVFAKGMETEFPESDRKSDIFFEYAV